MTYLPTWAGFVYLAVVLDAYSRKVVGWAFGQTGLRAAWLGAIALTDYKDSGFTVKDVRPKTQLTDIEKATGDTAKVQELALHSSIATTES